MQLVPNNESFTIEKPGGYTQNEIVFRVPSSLERSRKEGGFLAAIVLNADNKMRYGSDYINEYNSIHNEGFIYIAWRGDDRAIVINLLSIPKDVKRILILFKIGNMVAKNFNNGISITNSRRKMASVMEETIKFQTHESVFGTEQTYPFNKLLDIDTNQSDKIILNTRLQEFTSNQLNSYM